MVCRHTTDYPLSHCFFLWRRMTVYFHRKKNYLPNHNEQLIGTTADATKNYISHHKNITMPLITHYGLQNFSSSFARTKIMYATYPDGGFKNSV